MRKILTLCLFLLFTPFIMGEEIFISKPGDKDVTSCQAVRIKDNWFLTAAHCVADICNTSCDMEINLSGNILKTSQQNVSWHNDWRSNASYDIALINFKDAKISGSFTAPTILIIDNSIKFTEPKIINRSLKIPFDMVGKAGTIMSTGPIFYGPKSQIIFTRDLGLFHGLSGAGVFTDKGELIAITSATANKGQEVQFSVFSVFNEKVEEFLNGKGLSLYFKHVNLSDFRDITQNKEILISLDNNK